VTRFIPAHPLPADWLTDLHARARRPPHDARVPLRWRGIDVGTLDGALPEALQAAEPALPWRIDAGGVEMLGNALTPSLARVALALRDAGLVRAWRDEQLAVRGPDGAVLGSVERGAVRALGIATHAVHLVGRTPDGCQWVQKRSLSKPNDPGLWDTLMGGMVPASDSLEQALARETWEEAGLRLEQLQGLAWGGRVATCGPSAEHPLGYLVESIDWYHCVVPEGVEPRNQDGEVEYFACLPPAEVYARLLADAFTTEAALVLVAADPRPA
jgi:8-oxo-dGTP pyrophosphatase MutT (NUDIX family)